MGYIDRDLRYYAARLESAILVDPRTQPRDEVAFGAVVVARDQHGAEHRFVIVGEDEADVARDKVSWVSPVAEALLGARRGDEVVWRRPVGDLRLSVEAIDYPESWGLAARRRLARPPRRRARATTAARAPSPAGARRAPGGAAGCPRRRPRR